MNVCMSIIKNKCFDEFFKQKQWMDRPNESVYSIFSIG